MHELLSRLAGWRGEATRARGCARWGLAQRRSQIDYSAVSLNAQAMRFFAGRAKVQRDILRTSEFTGIGANDAVARLEVVIFE